MKARDSRPAESMTIAMPRMPLGMLVSSSCSRMPAKTVSARPKPMAVLKAYMMLCARLKSFWMTRMATPSTAQLVVMSGRKIPSA